MSTLSISNSGQECSRRGCLEMTRREWLHKAAGSLMTAGIPALLYAKPREQDVDPAAITGAGSLKAHAAARGLLTGAAVNTQLLRTDSKYREVLTQQYSIVVGENCMKFR